MPYSQALKQRLNTYIAKLESEGNLGPEYYVSEYYLKFRLEKNYAIYEKDLTFNRIEWENVWLREMRTQMWAKLHADRELNEIFKAAAAESLTMHGPLKEANVVVDQSGLFQIHAPFGRTLTVESTLQYVGYKLEDKDSALEDVYQMSCYENKEHKIDGITFTIFDGGKRLDLKKLTFGGAYTPKVTASSSVSSGEAKQVVTSIAGVSAGVNSSAALSTVPVSGLSSGSTTSSTALSPVPVSSGLSSAARATVALTSAVGTSATVGSLASSSALSSAGAGQQVSVPPAQSAQVGVAVSVSNPSFAPVNLPPLVVSSSGSASLSSSTAGTVNTNDDDDVELLPLPVYRC